MGGISLQMGVGILSGFQTGMNIVNTYKDAKRNDIEWEQGQQAIEDAQTLRNKMNEFYMADYTDIELKKDKAQETAIAASATAAQNAGAASAPQGISPAPPRPMHAGDAGENYEQPLGQFGASTPAPVPATKKTDEERRSPGEGSPVYDPRIPAFIELQEKRLADVAKNNQMSGEQIAAARKYIDGQRLRGFNQAGGGMQRVLEKLEAGDVDQTSFNHALESLQMVTRQLGDFPPGDFGFVSRWMPDKKAVELAFIQKSTGKQIPGQQYDLTSKNFREVFENAQEYFFGDANPFVAGSDAAARGLAGKEAKLKLDKLEAEIAEKLAIAKKERAIAGKGGMTPSQINTIKTSIGRYVHDLYENSYEDLQNVVPEKDLQGTLEQAMEHSGYDFTEWKTSANMILELYRNGADEIRYGQNPQTGELQIIPYKNGEPMAAPENG